MRIDGLWCDQVGARLKEKIGALIREANKKAENAVRGAGDSLRDIASDRERLEQIRCEIEG